MDASFQTTVLGLAWGPRAPAHNSVIFTDRICFPILLYGVTYLVRSTCCAITYLGHTYTYYCMHLHPVPPQASGLELLLPRSWNDRPCYSTLNMPDNPFEIKIQCPCQAYIHYGVQMFIFIFFQLNFISFCSSFPSFIPFVRAVQLCRIALDHPCTVQYSALRPYATIQ
jgi:hypothetical protein